MRSDNSKKSSKSGYRYSGDTKRDIDGRNATEHRMILQLVNFLDVLGVCAMFIIAWFAYYAERMHTPYYFWGNVLVIFLYFLFYYLLARLYSGFSIQISSISDIVYSQTLSAVIANLFIYIVMWLLSFRMPNIPVLLLMLGGQVGVIVIWANASHKWYFNHYPAKATVIIYDEMQDMDKLIHDYGMTKHFNTIRKINIYEIFPKECPDGENGKPRNSLEDTRIGNMVDDAQDVFLCCLHSHERNQIIKYCVAHEITVYAIPRIGDVIMSGAEKMHLFHMPILRLQRYNPAPEYLFFKRFFDILISGILLVILSPLMLVLTIIIRSDGGTAFYRQKRLTQNGRVFEVLKFRSMRMDAEKDGVARLSTGENDPRITKVGRFIRSCRMDELPQLINILKGDMSIVGPRPERPEIAQQYKETLPEFDLRLQCKCGLTGYAQVYGKYNTTPYDKLLMDLMYISKPSLAEDFKICLATVKILFMKDSTEGVADGQTTAEAGPQKETETGSSTDNRTE